MRRYGGLQSHDSWLEPDDDEEEELEDDYDEHADDEEDDANSTDHPTENMFW